MQAGLAERPPAFWFSDVRAKLPSSRCARASIPKLDGLDCGDAEEAESNGEWAR
jgi:hypothetical protein